MWCGVLCWVCSGTNLLNGKNDKPLRAGQVFAVTLGVAGLERPDAADPKDRVYAMQVGCLGGGGVVDTGFACCLGWGSAREGCAVVDMHVCSSLSPETGCTQRWFAG
jgi:hypothetical protein